MLIWPVFCFFFGNKSVQCWSSFCTDESEHPNNNFVRILSYLIGLMIMIIQICLNELFPSSVRKLDAFL